MELLGSGDFQFWLGGERGSNCARIQRESFDAWNATTLKEMLIGQTLVEFPTFLLVPASLAKAFAEGFKGWTEWDSLG
jgi:hypothetical protein